MFVLAKHNILYVYHTYEHLSAVLGRHEDSTMPLQYSFIALKLSDDKETCTVLKDRFCIFDKNNSFKTKKMLKIVEILMED